MNNQEIEKCRECPQFCGSGGGYDPCIEPLVEALNTCGMRTVASCCGHGFRPGNIALGDGREIIIARNWSEARKIDRIFPIAITGEDVSRFHESEIERRED